MKARALQYCLEDDVNVLRDDDWICHLDEETLLTENRCPSPQPTSPPSLTGRRCSARGVVNFCTDGKHEFGQGVITYANPPIVNWITTLSDSFRVADDMGKLRFQLSYFHRPIFGWKGSFVVTKASPSLPPLHSPSDPDSCCGASWGRSGRCPLTTGGMGP